MSNLRSFSIMVVFLRLAGLILIVHSLYAAAVLGVRWTPERNGSGPWNPFKRFYAEEEFWGGVFIATVVASTIRRARDEANDAIDGEKPPLRTRPSPKLPKEGTGR
jgi:hypothetical protein